MLFCFHPGDVVDARRGKAVERFSKPCQEAVPRPLLTLGGRFGRHATHVDCRTADLDSAKLIRRRQYGVLQFDVFLASS